MQSYAQDHGLYGHVNKNSANRSPVSQTNEYADLVAKSSKSPHLVEVSFGNTINHDDKSQKRESVLTPKLHDGDSSATALD